MEIIHIIASVSPWVNEEDNLSVALLLSKHSYLLNILSLILRAFVSAVFLSGGVSSLNNALLSLCWYIPAEDYRITIRISHDTISGLDSWM